MVTYDLSDLNGATRAIIIAISHDRDRLYYARSLALQAKGDSHILADSLREWVESTWEEFDCENTMLQDLMSSAIGAVDWKLVAEDVLDDLEEG